MTKRLIVFAPLALLVGVLVVGAVLLTREDGRPEMFAAPTRPAPSLTLAEVDGGELRTDDFRGRPVVVNIWATWCAPCRAEHPLLVELAAEGVDILGVLYKDPDLDLARRLLAEEGDPFAWHVLDPAGDAFIAFGSTGVPETFLIDADGMIVKTLRGPLTEATRDEFLAAWRAAEAGAAG